MRWVGGSDFDRVAITRAQCYGSASKETPKFIDGIRADDRAKAGDFLLAERDGLSVGTATSLSMSMWMRGTKIPCQGVAWVGTVKTHRRGSRAAGEGIASQIMKETLRLGREREQVVSALMPFRASFYDHFGYGIVERRNVWTAPLAVLPSGAFDAVRFYEPGDLDAMAACRQRTVERGQCDIERSGGGWAVYLKNWQDGWLAVDRTGDGPVRGYCAFQNAQKDGKGVVSVLDSDWEDVEALRRMLHFLASLRDQYTFATFSLPADLPLNRLLRETQLPHRTVSHGYAEVRPTTRMSIRVLDHKRLLEGMKLPAERLGSVVVAVKEVEGHESRFKIDIEGGRITVAASSATAELECADRIWAGIVSGDMPATLAVKLGLATACSNRAAETLDAFAQGPVPFCQEYF
jgi:predicted acetyltransferase